MPRYAPRAGQSLRLHRTLYPAGRVPSSVVFFKLSARKTPQLSVSYGRSIRLIIDWLRARGDVSISLMRLSHFGGTGTLLPYWLPCARSDRYARGST